MQAGGGGGGAAASSDPIFDKLIEAVTQCRTWYHEAVREWRSDEEKPAYKEDMVAAKELFDAANKNLLAHIKGPIAGLRFVSPATRFSHFEQNSCTAEGIESLV